MFYIYTVGMSLSGKTWLVNKIRESSHRRFVVVDTRSIHDMLNTMDPFKDDNSIEGESFELRKEFTYEIRKTLIRLFAENSFDIIQDSGNQIKSERIERLKTVKEAAGDITSILVYVNTDKETIKQRALDEDSKLDKPVWYDLYKKQLDNFEIPTAEEADFFIEYDGKDWKKVIEKVKDIVK